MLIGIDASRAAYPQRTGTENYSLHLIRHLLRIPSPHNFRLYFSIAPISDLFPNRSNWESRVIPFPRLWTHLRLSWEVARHPPDALFIPAHVLPLFHPPRSVVTVHDLGYLYYPQAHRAWDWLYLDFATRFNAYFASQVITLSQAAKDDLVKNYGINPNKITVIYPGIYPEFAQETDQAKINKVREKYRLPSDYILHLGTIHPRKNLETLLAAFRQVTIEGEAPHLLLAGKRGWMAEGTLGKIAALGLAERVHILGYVPEEDLPAILSGARLFVFPSVYEGFGFPVLEAMAAGVPVIASNASSIPEVGGDAVLLVDPQDHDAWAHTIRKALADESLRQQLVARGRERVKHFSWEKCAKETLAVLEQVAVS